MTSFAGNGTLNRCEKKKEIICKKGGYIILFFCIHDFHTGVHGQDASTPVPSLAISLTEKKPVTPAQDKGKMMKEEKRNTIVAKWKNRIPALPGSIILPVMIAVICVIAAWTGTPALAQEMISEQGPPPISVEETTVPMEQSFKTPTTYYRPLKTLQGNVKEKLKDTPAFFRDTTLNVNVRSYYFLRDKFDNTKSEALAIGGSIAYKSGYLYDRFALGAVGYTSQAAYDPDTRDGSKLLLPKQRSFTVLGQLYGEIKLMDNTFINFYRKEYNTPYINKDDSRMVPNTFEAYTLTGKVGGKDGSPEVRFGGGYFTKMKPKDNQYFETMSRVMGIQEDRGVSTAGANVTWKGLSLGAIDYYAKDIINIFYTEGKYTFPSFRGLGFSLSAQYANQGSNGDNLVTGDSFSTHQTGVKGEASFRNLLLTSAYTNTAEGDNMRSPWGGYPGYTKVQVQDFNRAGEQSFMVKLAYDFSRLGLKDVTAYALMVTGWGAIDPSTKRHVYNQTEYDYDIQWRPKFDLLKGLWFRARYAHVGQRGTTSGSTSINDLRFIVNYDFSAL
jgi:hypothetical protein